MSLSKQSLIQWFKKQQKIVMSLLAGLIIGGTTSTAVLAIIPDSNGVIHACYLIATGTVRIIDSPSASCTGLETAVSWSQAGPQGPTGPTGPTGPEGPQGDPGPGKFLNSLAGASLENTSLAYRDFADVSFAGATIFNIDFKGSNLSNADFSGAILNSNSTGIEFLRFSGTNASGANFAESSIGGYGMDIRNTDFSDVDFTDATFIGFYAQYIDENNFTGADFIRTTFNTSDQPLNFRSSDFSGAHFEDTSLIGVDLTAATLSGATWDNVTCPDNTNSNTNSNTCIGHLNP